MKRFLSVLFSAGVMLVAMLVCTCIIPREAHAASVSDLTFESDLARDGYMVYSCKASASGALEIPAIYNGKPVTSICTNAFAHCKGLTSVKIPDSVTYLGMQAFYNCTNLVNVYMGNGIQEIGPYVFDGCNKLQFNVYDNAKYLGNSSKPYLYLIKGPSPGVTSCVVHESTRTIMENAFDDSLDLAKIALPAGIMNIKRVFDFRSLQQISVSADNPYYSSDSYGVLYNKDMTEIVRVPMRMTGTYTIPNSVMVVGDFAFSGCTKLSGLIVPNSVNYLGDGAFAGSVISSVTTHGVTFNRGEGTFSDSVVQEQIIADGSEYIGTVFCAERVVVPNSVTNLSAMLLNVIPRLKEIRIRDDNPHYAVDAYGVLYNKNMTEIVAVPSGLTGAYTIPEGVTYISDYVFQHSSFTSITIPENVVRIGWSAFSNCSQLESVTLYGSKFFGIGAFFGCPSLTSVYTTSIEVWCDNFFETDELMESVSANPLSNGADLYLNGQLVTDLVLPENITEVGSFAFSGCTSLRSVVIPDGVDTIGSCAFLNCKNLTNIYIPDSVTGFGYRIVSGCSQLQYNVYDNAKYLGSVSNPYVLLIEATARDITSCRIHPNTKRIFSGAFADCASLSDIVIPKGVVYIYDRAFFRCTALTNLVIPESVTFIGDWALSWCSGLKKIILPNSLAYILEGAFDECTALEQVIYCGTEAEWAAIDIVYGNSDANALLDEVARKYHDFYNEVCTICGRIAEYTVTFQNWDGSVISSEAYRLGEEISIPATPTRPDDEEYTYRFVGWDKTVVSCDGEATYMAVYESSVVVRPPNAVTSSRYDITDGVISRIQVETTVAELLLGVDKGEFMKVYNENQEISEDAIVGTGMVLKIMDGDEVVSSVTIVVTGDTDGDGEIFAGDVSAAKSHLLNKSTLEGAYAQAADANGDGKVSVTDFLQIHYHTMGVGTVEPRNAISDSSLDKASGQIASELAATEKPAQNEALLPNRKKQRAA